MSFIDLATLTLHRRNELESRINQFSEKCDHAISEIIKLKTKSHDFVLQLNCDPSELKERFLNSMKLLDEYTYVMTDFNLAVAKLEETGNLDYTPVHDRTLAILPAPPLAPFNLLDALSEPTPSTSTAPTNIYPPEKPKRMHIPKEDQLIVFSSASCSSESVPQVKQEMATKEVQCQITEELKDMSVTETLEKASKAPPDTEYTSLEENNRDRGRRIKRRKVSTDSDTSDGDDFNKNGKKIEVSDGNSNATVTDQTPEDFHSNNSYSRTLNEEQLDDSERLSLFRVRHFEQSVGTNNDEDSNRRLKSIEEKSNKALNLFGNILVGIKEIKQHLGLNSNNNNCNKTNNKDTQRIKNAIPLETKEAIRDFEKLLSEEKYYSEFSRLIQQIGGSSGKEYTERIFLKIFSPLFAKNNTWDGKVSKYPVKDLTLINIVQERDEPLTSNQSCASNLPAQSLLEIDQTFKGTIMHVDGVYFWVIADCVDEVYELMTDMTQYYSEHITNLSVEEVKSLPYVAVLDDDCYYRGLFLGIVEEEDPIVEVFLVDTGERRRASLGRVQPLAPHFCTSPPYARCCHLAGIDLLSYQNESMLDAFEEYMKSQVGIMCVIHVDDNTSESLGVYIVLPNKKTLNEIVISKGLGNAIDTEESVHEIEKEQGSPTVDLDPELDISQCPEFEDPVEAVTGYHNRDEADICKHYKGGSAKSCYKGSKCTKKHVVKHPDGWTLDRVEVVAKCRLIPLPEPGTWHRVLVTSVCHFDRVYVQFVHDDDQTEEIPDFGVILPPKTLTSLIKDMNSPAARSSYKPLKISPAAGELVAALYPLDGNWYRARVVSITRADQNVEVVYVDYGTTMWVKEDQVKVLEARYHALPMQAARCVLAGVRARSHHSHTWLAARAALADRVLNMTLDALVIARDYDEITVELLDEQGYSVGEQLAALKLVELTQYDVVPDKNIQQKLVVP